MEIEERLIPVAAETGPRGELTDEKETRMDRRITEVRDSRSEGLAVDSACNPGELNRLAMAVASHQVGDPSLGEVTGEPAVLGPGLSYSPSLSSARKAPRTPELRQGDLTVDQWIEGSKDEAEDKRASAIQVIARRAKVGSQATERAIPPERGAGPNAVHMLGESGGRQARERLTSEGSRVSSTTSRGDPFGEE